MIEIVFEDKIFKTTQKTLERVPYFKKHFSKTPHSTEINMFHQDSKPFEHLLKALRLFQYRIPSEFEYECKYYYHVNYDNKKYIYLDVGGKIFVCDKQVLIERSNYFNVMIQGKWLHDTGTIEKPMFIDKDPEAFRYVMNYIYKSHHIPTEYKQEIDFYQINNIKTPIDVEKEVAKKLLLRQKRVKNLVEYVTLDDLGDYDIIQICTEAKFVDNSSKSYRIQDPKEEEDKNDENNKL